MLFGRGPLDARRGGAESICLVREGVTPGRLSVLTFAQALTLLGVEVCHSPGTIVDLLDQSSPWDVTAFERSSARDRGAVMDDDASSTRVERRPRDRTPPPQVLRPAHGARVAPHRVRLSQL